MHYHAKKIRAGQHPIYKHVKVNCDTITRIETMADIKARIAKTAGVPTPSVAQANQGAPAVLPEQAYLKEDDDDPYDDPLGWGLGLE